MFLTTIDTDINTVYIMLVLLPFVLLAYFAIVRPQRKKANSTAIKLNSVRVGQTVYTVSGIKGTVKSLNGANVKLVCPPDGTELECDLTAVKEIENYDEAAAKALMKQKITTGKSRLIDRKH